MRRKKVIRKKKINDAKQKFQNTGDGNDQLYTTPLSSYTNTLTHFNSI